MLIVVIYIIPEGRAAGSFQFLNLHHYMGITDKTVIMIAHHLNTIRDADQIVVMDSGRIVDTGRHNELLDRCALYRKMVENQNKVDNWKIKEVSL